MKELEDAIVGSFRKMCSDGVLTKIVNDAVQKTVKDVIESSIRSFGPFGKALEAAVAEALQFDPSKFGLPEYNNIILDIVRKNYESILSKQGAELIQRQLEELMAKAPAEITVSQLVKDFKEWAVESLNAEPGSSIKFECDSDSTVSRYRSIKLKIKSAKYSSDNKEFSIGINDDDEVYYVWVWNKKLSDGMFVGTLYGFERDLFRMYLRKTKIIFDTTDPDTYISDGSD
jgi:hypothetical protein